MHLVWTHSLVLFASTAFPRSLQGATQFQPSFAARYYREYFTKFHPIDRLLTIMRNLYVLGENRIMELKYKRAEYENTYEFEMGYVMGEIIERYRQLVLHLKNSLKFKNLKVHDKLIKLEFMQKLYFEIYHLVMMMNELPRKYGQKEEELTSGIEGGKNDNTTLADAMADLPAREQERHRQKMRKIKELQEEQGMPRRPTAKRTGFWPIDYGWSIENW